MPACLKVIKHIYSLQNIITLVPAITLLVTLLISPSPAYAQICSDPNGCTLDKTNFNDKINADNTLQNLISGSLCITAGRTPYGNCLGYTDEGPKLFAFLPSGGAVGSVTNLAFTLYSPPTSSVQYLANLGESLGLSEPAYAQTAVPGSGSGIIRPVLNLWQITRNVAYIFFIFVFLAIGFMIMFRQKINPQTVISAQTALPGLVVGLVLVTFSYFIAALLVDLSFVGMRLVTEVFIRATPNAFGGGPELRALADNSNLFQLFSSSAGVIWNNTGTTGAGLNNLATGTLGSFALLIPAIVGGIIGGLVFGLTGVGYGLLIGGATTSWASNIVSGLVSLVLIVGLLIQMFRLLLALLGTYIQILVAVVTGPLIILGASIPGRGGAISNWIKSLLANALIFPAVFAVFLFAGVILGNTSPTDWQVSPPLFGGLTAELLRTILAYGIMLGVTAVPDTVRTAFNVKGIQGFDKAALGGAMSGWGVTSGTVSKGWQATGLPKLRAAYDEQVAKYNVSGQGDPQVVPFAGNTWIGNRFIRRFISRGRS